MMEPYSQTGSFCLSAPLDAVMPLFTAEGERRWAKGWAPEFLSGGVARGSAFRTRNAQGQVTTWIVVAFDPHAGRASYARLAEGSNIGLVDVACTPAAGGGTNVSVTYTMTPLHAGAAGFVHEFLSPARYGQMIAEWAEATAAALRG